MILADGENKLSLFFLLKKIPQEGKSHIFVIYGTLNSHHPIGREGMLLDCVSVMWIKEEVIQVLKVRECIVEYVV